MSQDTSQDTDDTQDPDAGHEGDSATLTLGNQEIVLRQRFELLAIINDIGISCSSPSAASRSTGTSCSTWA